MDNANQDERFLTWLSEYRGMLVRVSRSFTDAPDDFDDLFQEILFRLWDSALAFRGESSAGTWVYRVALNRALRWRKSENRRRSRVSLTPRELTDLACEPVSDDDRTADLYAAIRKLKKVDRALIFMSLEGFSYRDIADVMDLTETNVGARLTRIRNRLCKLLGDSDS